MAYRRNTSGSESIVALTFGGIALIAAASIAISIVQATVTVDKVGPAVITGKERVMSQRGEAIDSKYLIFTDQEVFENTDSLLRWKFNSSDLYGKIKVGQTCSFVVNGWRIPILSMYRNTLSAECSQ